MILQKNIEYLNKLLGELPELYYHGRIGTPISNDEMLSQIVIYKDASEIKGKKPWEFKGRPYLDCAFHGFYLTPCEALARKWAFVKQPKQNEQYQILVFKADVQALKKLNFKINIVPDLEWAKHVFECRSRKPYKNEYDFVYSFIADGIMSEIQPKIEAGAYNIIEDFHWDILKERHKKFLKDLYGKREMTCKEVLECCNLMDYKNYQLCICSEKALKCFEIIDIISLNNDIEIVDNISVDLHLNNYKKFVPQELINAIVYERSVSKDE